VSELPPVELGAVHEKLTVAVALFSVAVKPVGAVGEAPATTAVDAPEAVESPAALIILAVNV